MNSPPGDRMSMRLGAILLIGGSLVILVIVIGLLIALNAK